MREKEKEVIGEIDISKTVKSNIDYWRNKCFEQQKEIEELKNNELDYTTIYMNGVYDGEKKVKDKIKEILKELDEFDENFFNARSLKEATKNSLKELLEEE